MSDDLRLLRERLSEVRRHAVRSDLNGLLMLVPADTLIERWGKLHLTTRDLNRVRREYAKDHHPDRSANPAAANRRVGMANAVIDRALAELIEET